MTGVTMRDVGSEPPHRTHTFGAFAAKSMLRHIISTRVRNGVKQRDLGYDESCPEAERALFP